MEADTEQAVQVPGGLSYINTTCAGERLRSGFETAFKDPSECYL